MRTFLLAALLMLPVSAWADVPHPDLDPRTRPDSAPAVEPARCGQGVALAAGLAGLGLLAARMLLRRPTVRPA